MKKAFQKVMVLILAVSLLCNFSLSVQAATAKSDGQNMEKLLKYYGKNKISKAKKYNKKLNAYAKEACVKKMSSKMKKAYKKIVKKWPVDAPTGTDYLWGYYLTDIDNDKKADLLVQVGTCEADARTHVYKYKNGKAVKIATIGSGHTSFHAYPNHKGVIFYSGHMGNECISVVTIKNGKVSEKTIGYRGVITETTCDWLDLKCVLKRHISYDANHKRKLDLGDLK